MKLLFCGLVAGLLLASFPSIAQAASLSVAPTAASVSVGQSVSATIRVNAGGTAINAAEASVVFPSDLLKLTSVSKSGTIFKFWTIEPSGSNSSARVIFSGGLPSPGYSGSAGTIIRITWQAQNVGTAALKISGGKILANDGLGTNVLTSQTGATVTITAAAVTPPPTTTRPTGPVTPTVTSTEYSSEQQWSSSPTATLLWTKPTGIEGVSYILDREATTTPDEIIETNTGTTTVTLTEDGVWYFHLRAKYPTGWSAVRHLKLQHDRTAPMPFEITLTRDRGLADPSPTLTFAATDALSGIGGYTVSLNGSAAVPVTSPYTAIANQAGEYRVVITATDNAGNVRESDISFSVEGYATPIITNISTPLILLQPLMLRGTALAGDRVNIFLDGELLGSTYAGGPNLAVTDGTTVRLPWTFRSEKTFSPGQHRVTTTATSADGQTSIATDPVTFVVRGATIQFNGRPIATFAAIPILGLLIIVFFTLVAVVMARLWTVTRRLEHRETVVDQELKELQRAVSSSHISDEALEKAIALIDDDLTGRRRPTKRVPRRRSKKNS